MMRRLKELPLWLYVWWVLKRQDLIDKCTKL
ncbi:hypothetical protein ANDROMEDA_48 [Bacillus phage Andromeda]|uniref:Uncharacterized protein n=2 Tax=Andromedavirus andromeda TaxID=1273739 RepID=M1HNL5_9CAUD|nr:hypothetical protein I905_gp48 [Bacillus phage Andromeda]AGE60887.1 hypothetical protein GEMINI_48 [Bacillus phage Gemini]AGE61118.1 hypothetical protein ANDROMEDA_48 [Bacillus phage Andromeda]